MSSASQYGSEVAPDLSTCEREPIHIPGAIEPNGALLVVQEPELVIVQASANTRDLLGVTTESLLGTPLSNVFEEGSFRALVQRVIPHDLEGKRRYLSRIEVQGSSTTFDASIHRLDGLLVVELEPVSNASSLQQTEDLHATLSDIFVDLGRPLTTRELCARAAKHVKHLTGFDRVMVYRFFDDGTGAVIAEERRDDLTPYLGLRYPASDIPAQARRLYLLNTLRLKPDVNAARVSIVPPVNPVTGQPLDMSHCVLRAMSPVHDEYLRNMGVTASMSVSIIKDEQLWGLIACHHTSKKLVPHSIRMTCEAFARVFSVLIARSEAESSRSLPATLRQFHEGLERRLRESLDVQHALAEERDHIVSAINAHGGALFLGGNLALAGDTPSQEDVQRLLEWLGANQNEHVLSTDKLSSLYPEASNFSDTASGLLSARVALGGADFLLWFRPAVTRVVDWAGNPSKPIEETEGGRRISPRLSFERWKEIVKDKSEPWQEHERDFAVALRRAIAEVLLVQKNEQVSRLNLELERSNIELDAFAYAASHDLQEPVRTIRAYTQLLSRRAGPKLDDAARELLTVIENGAVRMGSLISALLTYGQIGGNKDREPTPVNLEETLAAVLLNLNESIRASDSSITHEPLPSVTGDPDHLMQVLQNLIANAIKYRKPQETPQVHISASLQSRMWHISVKDNGQGFRPEEAEMIFGAFKRLHGKDIPGAGIGLALCKRIVEGHGGRIWAESKGRGEGATFWFTLPVT